jgi:hypothetical protein
MSFQVYYTFFDRAVADRVWPMSWKKFLSHYRNEGRGFETLAIAYNPTSAELKSGRSEEEVFEGVLAKRTIRWTALHSTPPFFVFGEVLGMDRRLRKCPDPRKCPGRMI